MFTSRRLRAVLFLFAPLAIFVAFATLSFGQATDGIIVGSVTDASGASVANAKISATNKATNVKYDTVTNVTGEYRINNVPAGTYDVAATASGFAAGTVANVLVELNHTASVNMTLTVGSVTTQVEVQEAAATIDTSTAQLQTTYDARTAVDIPMAGAASAKVIGTSGIWNLSLVGAGVASAGGVGQGTGPSVAGQRPEANSFNIDGVLNDDHYGTGPQVYISNEAIAQFNLVQNQFSAEFGGGSGGIFNVIVKSGTDQIHGSIYEYFQNRDLNAVDASWTHQGIYSLPRFDFNRLGASIGGPIKKDKLFYFGDFEYAALGQASAPPSAIYAPTQAGISALNGISGLSKTNLGVFEKYVPVAPTATSDVPISVNGVNIPTGPLSVSGPNYTNFYDAVAAVDYNISDKDQVRGRFIYANYTGIDANAYLPVFYTPVPNISKSVSVSEFHNFSPTLENELRLSYKRNNQSYPVGNFQFPGLSAFPNLSLDDLGLQIGPDPNIPSGFIENTAQLQDNITKSWGKHTIKAGYAAVDVILAGFFVQRVRGDYDYASLEEFLLDQVPSGSAFGTPNSGERTVGATSGVPFGFVQHSAFVNDDFRVRPNLTLNLGLRYEYVTVPVGSRYQAYSSPANVPGVISFNSPKSNPNEWSPRLGFAYSPGNKGVWSIRGGVSRSFYNTYINLNQNGSPAYFATTVDVGPNTPVNNFLANGGLAYQAPGVLTPAAARAAVSTYTFDQTRPYALNGTIGVQRLLGKDYTFEARYVYTKGVHLWNQTRLNIISPVTPSEYIPTYTSMPSAAALSGLTTTLGQLQSIPRNTLAQYGFPNNIVGYHPWGNSRYNGLALQLTKRYSKNFSVIGAYTWSHAFDDSTATNFSTILSPRRAQDYQNMAAEWASSALDRRQRLTITPIYDFKPFQNKSWLMKNVVGNWNISFTYTAQSPEYATVQSGVDANLNGDALDRSIINPAGATGTGSAVVGYTATGQQVPAGTSCSSGACKNIVAYVATNPNARYITAGLGALSNSGRNTLPLDAINNWDAQIRKSFNITERIHFDIGAQAFNLFNHSQFVGGFISDVAPDQTETVSTAFLQSRNADFGDYKAYFPSNSRSAQLTAHIVF